jgi:2,3-diketo-5-methylthio-1-phosphopentane phosphatase
LLHVSWETALAEVLQSVEIESTFPEFIAWLKEWKIPFIILSGGIEELVKQILNKYNLGNLEIRANAISIVDDKWKLIPSTRPKIRGLCNHCKTFSLVDKKEAGYFTVYIGDGQTDRCPASHANLVFAKGELANYCYSQKINFYHFNNFSDIKSLLKDLLKRVELPITNLDLANCGTSAE